MVLAIDIGNTNIVLGVFREDKLTFVSRISADPKRTDVEYAVQIKQILLLSNIEKAEIHGCIISSVVPPLTKRMYSALKKAYGVESLVVGPGIKTGINLLVDNPTQVGADLITASVAAYNFYKAPVLIVDMGTATKMMVVDSAGAFRGVSIIPGVDLSLKALAGNTAQLPQISLEAPKYVIAKNTEDCMKSGVVFGNASLVDGMIDRMCEEFGSELTLIATGGLSEVIIPHCKHNITLAPNLVLDGLYLIYKKNTRN